MEDNILIQKVSQLPEDLKSEVFDFIDFLLFKIKNKNDENKKPVFGSGKGMFEVMPGFDEPLEDFKDYM